MLKHRGGGGGLQMWGRKEQSQGLHDSTFFPPWTQTYTSKASRKPAVGAGEGEEVLFHIRAVNQFHALYFSYGGLADWLAGWLTEQLAVCMKRNVLWINPQHSVTD